MRDEDDTLFSGRGALPEDLARLERALAKLPLPPEPDWNARPRPERRPPVFAWAAAAALVIASAALLLLGRDAWRVETLAGKPSLGGVAFAGRIALGGVVTTDTRSRARLDVTEIGRASCRERV